MSGVLDYYKMKLMEKYPEYDEERNRQSIEMALRRGEVLPEEVIQFLEKSRYITR